MLHIGDKLIFEIFDRAIDWRPSFDPGISMPISIIGDKLEEKTGSRPSDPVILRKLEELELEKFVERVSIGDGGTLYNLTGNGFHRKMELEYYLGLITFKHEGKRWVVRLNGVVWGHFHDRLVENIEQNLNRITHSLVMTARANREILRLIGETFTLESRSS